MQNTPDKYLDDLDSPNASARVEITPEMVEAGVQILTHYEWGWSNAEEYARRIFIAMYEARPQGVRSRASPSCSRNVSR